MTIHSTVSASACERWWNCPGSVRLSVNAPRSSSVHADEGSVAHSLCEGRLKGKLTVEKLQACIGRTVKYGESNIEITEEMVRCVELFVAEVKRVYALAQESWGVQAKLVVEERLDLSHVSPLAFGTCDAAILTPAGDNPLDFKYGRRHVVEVENNKQLLYYACGVRRAALRHHVIRVSGHLSSTITIVQPRAKHPGGPIRKSRVSFAELDAFESELKIRVEATQQEDSPCNPGNWCTFCLARDCGAAHQLAVSQLQQDFDPVVMRFPTPDRLTPEQVARVMDYMPLVQDWFKSMYAHAMRVLDTGGEIPGYKLTTGKSNRAWKDAVAVEREMALLAGEAIYDRALKSPAQMEKIVGKETVAMYTHRPDGKKSVAKVEDARPSAENSLQKDFTPIENQDTGENDNGR